MGWSGKRGGGGGLDRAYVERTANSRFRPHFGRELWLCEVPKADVGHVSKFAVLIWTVAGNKRPLELTSVEYASSQRDGNAAASKAHSIEILMSLWTKDRRAKGGWWALAGFSFQSAIYLTRFFKELEKGVSSPSDLATTELLSDILVPKDGAFTLIQAKRTLDRPRLLAALREAYEIAKLCDVSLLASLRFEIACIKCTTPARPKDFSLREIGGDAGDAKTWDLLLRCFDENDCVVEEPDPLDHLRDFLWRAGIRDAAGFVDDCLGLLLRRFGNPSQQAVNELAWELSQIFYAARDNGAGVVARVGLALSATDVELDPQAATDRGVLFDRRPQLVDLRLGRVRERPAVFSGITAKFEPWWRNVAAVEEVARVPVFWIAGRSGEGKSVLLMQLMRRVLTAEHPPVVTFLSSADELPTWIEHQRDLQQGHACTVSLPAVAVVDDLHFMRDREAWGAAIAAATALVLPRVAVLTCGPTLECEKFGSSFPTLFEVLDFSVPNLERDEMEAFGSWVAERTRQRAQVDPTDTANRMLVVWIFELLRGESIRTFAGNFKRRLVALDLFDIVRSILAVNALEMPAPRALVESMSDNQRDSFDALCEASQLHFEKIRSKQDSFEGYWFSHPQIAWYLYREWASAPATLAQHWGRDLAPSLLAEPGGAHATFANNLIYGLGGSSKLTDGAIESLHTRVGTIGQSLGELYRKQVAESSVEGTTQTLPRWLELVFRGLVENLDPDPVQQSIFLASDKSQAEVLPPYVAGWLWRLSEKYTYEDSANELRAAARSIIFVAPPKYGIGQTLGVIAAKSKDREAALQLCISWLQKNPTHEGGIFCIESLIGSSSQDEQVMLAGLRWVEGNPTHQQAYQLLAPLVAAYPADNAVAGIALRWVEDNPSHQQAYQLLAALVAAYPADNAVAGIALRWVEDNPTHQQAYQLLEALVAAHPADNAVAGIALRWVEDNPTHQQAYQLLAPLVAAYPADNAVAGIALRWVEDNPTHPQTYWLLAALVAAYPADNAVAGTATKWVEDNLAHPQAYELIKALVAARPVDEGRIRIARIWLSQNGNHRHAYTLLVTLITRTDGAEEWMQKGQTALLDTRGGARRSLLVALVAGSKADRHYVELALDESGVERDIRNRTFLLGSLGRCLANNIQNALLFLTSQAKPEYKLSAAKALARALRKYSNRAREFLEQVDASPTEYTGLLLSACIASEVSGEVLGPVLRRWLNNHRRARGYGAVLKALKHDPARWAALIKHGDLILGVRTDYQNWQ